MDTTISSISSEKTCESKKLEKTYKPPEPPPYIYKLNRNFKNTTSEIANGKPSAVVVATKQVKIHYENETNTNEKKFDSLDANHYKNKCDQIECVQCKRRYSAADAVTTTKTSPPKETNLPSNEITSIIKKSSNLKKSNSNFLKPKLAGEKVKFSDVELRHLISDMPLDGEEDKMIMYNTERLIANNQRKIKQQSLPPLRNTKRKKLILNHHLDQFHYDKLCSLQQLRTNSSPPENLNPSVPSMVSASRSKPPRRLKYSNTLSNLDLERMRSRSIGRDYDPSSIYYLDDYANKRNKDYLLKKNSQPLIDDDHLSNLYKRYT